MKTFKQLCAYVLFVCFVAVVYTNAGAWLVGDAVSKPVTPRAAQIPPRIAASIERKKERTPAPLPEPAPAPQAEPPIAMPLQSVRVSLPVTKPQGKLPKTQEVKVVRHRHARSAVQAKPSVESYHVPVVATARTDTPY